MPHRVPYLQDVPQLDDELLQHIVGRKDIFDVPPDVDAAIQTLIKAATIAIRANRPCSVDFELWETPRYEPLSGAFCDALRRMKRDASMVA